MELPIGPEPGQVPLQTGCRVIDAAGLDGQASLVPELGCVLSPGLIARDQIPCPVQAPTEWYEARHDGGFMLNFGRDVKWPDPQGRRSRDGLPGICGLGGRATSDRPKDGPLAAPLQMPSSLEAQQSYC